MTTIMKISSRNLVSVRRRSLVKGGMAAILASGLAPGFARSALSASRFTAGVVTTGAWFCAALACPCLLDDEEGSADVVGHAR